MSVFWSVSPARAGMVPTEPGFARLRLGFPRASGDGPSGLKQYENAAKFPPRERGWSHGGRDRNPRSVVSPARAGMVPVNATNASPAASFPRASGDGPLKAVCRRMPLWVSPARAGMVTTTVAAYLRGGGFPRASGDDPIGWNLQRLTPEFPPRERGWSRTRLRSEMTTYVSPARAGMVLGGQWSSSHQDCFPRASGDGPHSRRRLIDVIEFPPRERGWSPTWVPCRLPCSGFPRASGDGP